MEILIAFSIALIHPLIVLLTAGREALSINIKYWPSLIAGLLQPFIRSGNKIRLRVKDNKIRESVLKPVSSEEIFDPVLQLEEPGKTNENTIQFSARA